MSKARVVLFGLLLGSAGPVLSTPEQIAEGSIGVTSGSVWKSSTQPPSPRRTGIGGWLTEQVAHPLQLSLKFVSHRSGQRAGSGDKP